MSKWIMFVLMLVLAIPTFAGDLTIPCEETQPGVFQCFDTTQPRLAGTPQFKANGDLDLSKSLTVLTALCKKGVCTSITGTGYLGSATTDGRYVISRGYYLAPHIRGTAAFKNGTGPLKGVNPSGHRSDTLNF